MYYVDAEKSIVKNRYVSITSTCGRVHPSMISKYEAVLKAAGDPTRARILKLLENGELCVCQIMDVMKLGQSTISGHLAILRGAGLVRDRKDGRWAYYSLSDRKQNRYSPPMAGPAPGLAGRRPPGESRQTAPGIADHRYVTKKVRLTYRTGAPT